MAVDVGAPLRATAPTARPVSVAPPAPRLAPESAAAPAATTALPVTATVDTAPATPAVGTPGQGSGRQPAGDPAGPVMAALADLVSSRDRAGELAPWQSLSSHHVLAMAARLQAGESAPTSAQLVAATLSYLAVAQPEEPAAT